MSKWQKIGLLFLIVGTLAYIKMAFFPDAEIPLTKDEQPVQEQEVKKEEEEKADVPKSYATIYFIGQNQNKEEIYKVVKREYSSKKDGTKIKFAIVSLLQGPTKTEKNHGVYSEIPKSTKLLSMDEKADKIIINLSGDFEHGGGTEGLYKRLYQLIKTANRNTSTPVYLHIDGKKAEVIGGEGIMINQPLSEKSLDE